MITPYLLPLTISLSHTPYIHVTVRIHSVYEKLKYVLFNIIYIYMILASIISKKKLKNIYISIKHLLSHKYIKSHNAVQSRHIYL